MNLFLKKLPTFLSRVISRFVFGTNMERIPSRQEQRSRFTWKASSIFSILLEPIVKLLAEFCCDVIWTIYFVPYALNAWIRVSDIVPEIMTRKLSRGHPSWGRNWLCIGEIFNIRTFKIYQRATFGDLYFFNFGIHFRNVNWIVGFGFVLWLSIAYCFANLNHRISFLVKNMVMVRTCFIGVRYGCVPLFKKAFGANIALITS